MGKDTAQKTYERLISEFSDQPDAVNEARNRLANLKQSIRVERAELSLNNPTTTLIINQAHPHVVFSYVRDKPYGFLLEPTLLII